MMSANLRDALRGACAEIGIAFRNVPADGRWHETDVEDDRNGRGDGRIKLFADSDGGIVWNWKGDQRVFFADDGRKLTEAERRERDCRRAEAIREAEEEEAQRRAKAAKKAVAIWKEATPAPNDYSYLTRKGIKTHGLALHNGLLVVPMRDASGMLHSLQFIPPDGKDKRFLKDGRTEGCYFGIGKPNGALCIAEGFATGASIHEATGCAVAVAFNAGNLEAVAKALREKFPELRIIVCADDDFRTEGNPGLTKATGAAPAAFAAMGGFVGRLAGRREGAAVQGCMMILPRLTISGKSRPRLSTTRKVGSSFRSLPPALRQWRPLAPSIFLEFLHMAARRPRTRPNAVSPDELATQA